LEYGSRALSRLAKQLRAELFFQFSIFARETLLVWLSDRFNFLSFFIFQDPSQSPD